MYVPKNKGETSSKENADLKSISVHPNFLAIIKEPFARQKGKDRSRYYHLWYAIIQ